MVHNKKSVVFQNMITDVLLWSHFSPSRFVPVQKSIQFIDTYCIAKFASGHSYLCTISSGFAGLLWLFYEHTVTVLIFQLFSCLTATDQDRRAVSFTISLQHTD